MASSDVATEDGYDVQMQTNHLSHFLLASILLPSLERAAAENGSARVVTHTSVARKRPVTWLDARYLQKKGGDLGGDWALPRWERYHQSKLANIVFAQALQVRHPPCRAPALLCACFKASDRLCPPHRTSEATTSLFSGSNMAKIRPCTSLVLGAVLVEHSCTKILNTRL